MGVLYFVPARRFADKRVPDVVKARRVDASALVCLEDLGLGHLDGAGLTFRVVRNGGPDGGAGLCIGLRLPANETGVFAGQSWMPCAGGDVWLGWTGAVDSESACGGTVDRGGRPAAGKNTAGTAVPHSSADSFAGAELRPGPEVFLRGRAPRATVDVVLGDGQAWGFVETEALPQRAVFDGSGERAWAPRACDEAHYAASSWIFDYVKNGGERPYFEVIDRVAVCLRARYHVSAMEVIALGLFTTDLLDAVVYACLGIDYVAQEKKSEMAGAER